MDDQLSSPESTPEALLPMTSLPIPLKEARKKRVAKKIVKAKKVTPAKKAKAPMKKAPAKPNKKTSLKKKSTGTRYSPEYKANVLKWLRENPERGNIGKALKKFGISYISLRGWLKNVGVKVGGKSKGKVGRPAGVARGGKQSGASVSGFSKSARNKILKGLALLMDGFEGLK